MQRLFVFLALISLSLAHKCYVCGPKSNNTCDNFDPADPAFVMECPSAGGCSTQTHANFVERSCENISLHDCKNANDVEYCFCASSLCNGKTILYSDDEDLEEGSGIDVTPTIEDIRPFNASAPQHYPFATFIPVMILLMK